MSQTPSNEISNASNASSNPTSGANTASAHAHARAANGGVLAHTHANGAAYPVGSPVQGVSSSLASATNFVNDSQGAQPPIMTPTSQGIIYSPLNGTSVSVQTAASQLPYYHNNGFNAFGHSATHGFGITFNNNGHGLGAGAHAVGTGNGNQPVQANGPGAFNQSVQLPHFAPDSAWNPNSSRSRAIPPSDLIRPPPEIAARPHAAVVVGHDIGVHNAQQMSRMDLGQARESRVFWFPNFDLAATFYAASFRVGILRFAARDDYMDAFANAYGGTRHLGAITTRPTAGPSCTAPTLPSSCPRCGYYAPAGAVPPSLVAPGPDTPLNPKIVPSNTSIPQTSGSTNSSLSFGIAPPRITSRPQDGMPLPRLPRPFPLPPPSSNVLDLSNDDKKPVEPDQPRKKAKTTATRIPKDKGKGRAKFYVCPDGYWYENLDIDPSTSASQSEDVLKHKIVRMADAESVSAGPLSLRTRDTQELSLNRLRLRVPNSAELAFRKMGNRPGDPDILPGSSSSSSPSTSSSPDITLTANPSETTATRPASPITLSTVQAAYGASATAFTAGSSAVSVANPSAASLNASVPATHAPATDNSNAAVVAPHNAPNSTATTGPASFAPTGPINGMLNLILNAMAILSDHEDTDDRIPDIDATRR